MKHIIFFGLMLLPAVSAAGQKSNVDSLIHILNTGKQNADEQLDLYLKICQGYYASYDSEHNIFYARKGLALAEQEKDKLRISKFNEYLGYGYQEKTSYDTARVYFERMLEAATAAKDKEQQVGAYVCMSSLYGTQGKYALSLEYSFKALLLSESRDNKQQNMSILSNIGTIYSILNNYDRAIYYYEQVLELAEKADENIRPIFKRNIYYKLSIIYRGRKELDKALDYAQESLELSRSTENKVYEAINLQLIAKINFLKDPENYDSALHYAKESLRLSEESGYHDAILSSWCVLSEIYGEKKQFKEAEEFAFKAWELDSLNILTNPNTIATQLLYCIALSNIFLGNEKKAAYFLQKYDATMLLYSDKSLHTSVAEMEVKYETEKKEMRIASLEKERQLYVWLGIASALLVFTLGIVLWQTIKNARKEKLLIATRSVLDGEMRERTRLARDLHDRLSGNLSAVKIELGNHAESLQAVRDKLDNCIKDIRNAAHDLMPASLQSGLKMALNDFAAQFPNVRFHFFGEEKRMEERIEFVVYCCANELVNNSVKHSGAKNIDVQLVQGDDYIALTVEDDGCGFDEKSAAKGMGLKSIRDRVASCGGKMDAVTSQGKGTETTVEIKVKS